MRIDGGWFLLDTVLHPIVRGAVQTADGSWVDAPFLVDTGADRTVFNAGLLADLGVPMQQAPQQLAGVGGSTQTVVVDTQIRLKRDDGGEATFTGRFAAFPDPEALDMSVLGRDITNLFAVIVDRPQDLVCLLTGRHRYVIEVV